MITHLTETETETETETKRSIIFGMIFVGPIEACSKLAT